MLSPLTVLLGALLAGVSIAPEPASSPTPSSPRPLTQETVEALLLLPYPGTLAEARAEALERNASVCMMLAIEDSESSDRFVDQTFRSKLLLDRSSDYVLLWGNNGHHDTAPFEVGRDEDGKPIVKELCKRFRTPTCDAHKKVLDAAWTEFAVDGELDCPRAIVLKPDGSLHEDLFTGESIGDRKIVTSIDAVIKQAGAPFSIEELTLLRSTIAAALAAQEAYEFAEEWRQWQRVLDSTKSAHWTGQARTAQKEAISLLQDDFDTMVAFEEESPVQAYKAWYERLSSWAGTPLIEPVEKRMKLLERSKETRDEIRTWKRAQEAQAMLDEAIELVKAGQEKKAERVAKKLIRKYAKTPAGERAAKKWPHLVSK